LLQREGRRVLSNNPNASKKGLSNAELFCRRRQGGYFYTKKISEETRRVFSQSIKEDETIEIE